jgi:hypothetical protein
MELDTEAFIYETERHPTIWDVASDDYSDGEKNTWEESVNIFICCSHDGVLTGQTISRYIK